MQKQQGVSLSGLIVVIFITIVVLLLGFKLFKPYVEYFAIQKIFRTMATKPEVRNGTRRDAMQSWASFATIEGVSSLSGDEIEINKDGGGLVISASYQVKIPLFKNYTLLIDFNPSSASAGP